MANTSIGKRWEQKVKETYEKQFPGTFLYRLPDQQSGYGGTGGSNPCDFFFFPGSCMMMVECKAVGGASISFNEIRQYEKMKDYIGLEKTYPGVLVWFYEKDTIIWVSIDEMVKMKEVDGEKSIGLRMIDEKKLYKKSYNILNVPATKLRTFMEADLKFLVNELCKN